MNKIYRVVWNHAKRTWMVVSELSRNATKSKANKTTPSATNVIKLSALSLALSAGFASAATYEPKYGTVPDNNTPQNSIAIGEGSKVESTVAPTITGLEGHTGKFSTAIGYNATAKADLSTALGGLANASFAATAVGGQASADKRSVAVGYNASATGFREVFVGDNAGLNHTTTTEYNIGVGYSAGSNLTGNNTISIGNAAGDGTSGSHNIAIGTYANAKVAGPKADVTSENNIAIGNSALANGLTSYKTTDPAAVTSDTGKATAVGSHAKATGIVSSAYGADANASAIHSTALGSKSKATGDNSTAVGYEARTSGHGSTALGYYANATALLTTAVGTNSNAIKDYDSAFGREANASGGSATALGNRATASGAASVALGVSSKATNQRTIAIGDSTNASGFNTIAIGRNATAEQTDAVALGSNSVTAAAVPTTTATVNGITYSGFAGTAPIATVSIGAEGKERTITNVAAGRISLTSTDAINGSQLYLTQQAIGNVATTTANILGGGATVTENGNITFPTYTLVSGTPDADKEGKQGTYNNVSAALSALNTAVISPLTFAGDTGTNFERRLGSTVNIKGGYKGTLTENNIGVVADGTDTLTIKLAENVDLGTNGSLTTGDTVVNNAGVTIANGAAGKPVSLTKSGLDNGGNKIINVAAGDADTDAVNVSQLKQAISKFATHYVSISDDGIQRANYDNTGSSGVNSMAVGVATSANGDLATALGSEAKANGERTTAVGPRATADGMNATSVGYNANASATNALAVGSAANANGDTSTAIGTASTATAARATALGAKSEATGENSTAVGYEASSTGAGSLAAGYNANAAGTQSTALGNSANAGGMWSTAVGRNANAAGGSAIALGNSANAAGAASVALGVSSQATATGAVALGQNAKATHQGSVALGTNSETAAAVATKSATLNGNTYTFAGTTPSSTVSIGSVGNERTLTNVAAGRISDSSTDAINGSQLYAAYTEIDSLNTKVDELSNGTLTFVDDAGTAIARKLGDSLNVKGGADADKLTDNNIGVVATDANTLTVKLAKDIDLTPAGSVTVGNSKLNNNGLTITNGPSVTTTGVDAGKLKVTNVADGDISPVSKDAVNGSQLYATASSVANALGGGSTVNTDGTVSAPSYTVVNGAPAAEASKTVNNVGDAITALNDAVTSPLTFAGDSGTASKRKLGSTVTVKGGVSSEAQLTDNNIGVVSDGNGTLTVKLAKDIKVNSVTAKTVTADTVKAGDTTIDNNGLTIAGGPSVTKSGINAAGNKITNVKAGTADTDAVNVSQLRASEQNINNKINNIDAKINRTDKRLRAGIAGATATAGLPQAYLPGKSMLATSGGTYRNEAAIAVGYSRISDNGKVIWKVTGNSNTRGDFGGSLGMGYQW
ncbi:YadA-like family protein [Mannheimia granulomatis]|uniref:YadA-like family protein n=1 Tax=Mannheimia granulomatis TaxID=85402 RepID=UPI00047A68CA|nr:YadA-like family protein [Mannheimia granulomatis]QLB18483.1 adhesin [Mannheimia granulomatis]